MKINELRQSETKTSKSLDASLNFERSPHLIRPSYWNPTLLAQFVVIKLTILVSL